MGEQSEQFASEVEELFSKRINAFAEWVAANWKFDGADNDLGLTPEQAEGWNRCCDGIKGAAAVWLEEWGP